MSRRITWRFTPPSSAETVSPYFETDYGHVSAGRAVSAVGQDAVDLAGIGRDLTFVESFGTRLLRSLKRPAHGREPDVVTALQDAALIRYRRCFAFGVRSSLTRAVVREVVPELVDVHDHLFELADKNVAHSVNGKEVLEPAVLTREDGAFAGHALIRMFGYEEEATIQALVTLARTLRTVHVEPRRKHRENEFGRECAAMVPEVVSALPVLELPVGVVIAPIRRKRAR